MNSPAQETSKSSDLGRGLVYFAAAFPLFFLILIHAGFATAGEYAAPWKDKSKAIIIDAYEKNPIDWEKLVTDKRIVAFIAKGSDGLPPSWDCPRHNDTEKTLCRKTFQNYWLKKQLYQSRRLIAKQLGLKWGAYHLGRPGNPIEQANHFLKFAEPSDDELMVIDIEHDDPENWISFADAEAFAKHIKLRTGRYPILYTNHDTAKRIAARRVEFPILSRLPLWYARFRSEIRGVFPMGHWETYALWQFSAQPNCNKRRCLYRVPGTKPDIDVNVSSMPVKQLLDEWPFGSLVPEREFDETEPDTLIVAATRQATFEAHKRVVEEKVRYPMDVEFTLEKRRGKKQTLKVASIAVPTARVRQENSVPETAKAGTQMPVDLSGYKPGAVARYVEIPANQADRTRSKSDYAYYDDPTAKSGNASGHITLID